MYSIDSIVQIYLKNMHCERLAVHGMDVDSNVFDHFFRKCLMNIKNSYFEKLNNEKKYRFPFTLK